MCASQAPIGDADGHTEGRDTDDVGRQTGSQDTAPCLRNLSMAGSLVYGGVVSTVGMGPWQASAHHAPLEVPCPVRKKCTPAGAP